MAHPPRALVCIPTYKRPEGLRRVLGSLPAALQGAKLSVTVLVLDNECSDDTRQLVADLAAPHGLDCRYAQVAEPGISAVRNAALQQGRDYDFVAFIDDDEEAGPGWLAGLHDVLTRHAADVAVGPVRRQFEGAVPGWVSSGDAHGFEEPRVAEGAELPWCATNNTLLARRVIDLVPDGFDARYGLTGGGDSHFFFRATQAGARIVWAPDVAVVEHLPAERAQLAWLLRRAYRSGTVRSRIERDVLGWGRWSAVRFAKGAGGIVVGTAKAALGMATRSRPAVVNGLQRVAGGLGTLAGLAGLQYTEYRRPKGMA